MRAFAANLEHGRAALALRRELAGAIRSMSVVALLGCSDVAAPSGPMAAASRDAGADPAAPPVPLDSAEFACDETAQSEPAELRRLTMTQYKNTLRDLTRWALGDALEAELAVSWAGLEAVPLDRREPSARDPHGSFRRLDQAVDQTHVDATFRVATALGSILSAPERLGRVAGTCATDAETQNDEACVTSFIRRFGARALRRPLDADDERFYRVVYGSDPAPAPAAFADVIAVMLSSPEFLYFVEHGDAEVPGVPGSYRISPYELASRLSYHFWQTLPDDALWQAAEDGSLLQREVLEQHVARLMADERAHATMAELFTDWLMLDDLPALDAHAQDPVYAAFAGPDVPGPELRQHMIDEALEMLAYYTWHQPAGLTALFESDRSFARSADLARIYGIAPWDGTAAPPALAPGERPGLLTRAWFLASGSVSSRPIRRGVFVRQRLLCDELAPPPSNVSAVPPVPLPNETTRQRVEALTEQPDTACGSCHASLINPLGFAFEGFDALGRARADERTFGDDGTLLGSLPIDTTSVPQVVSGDLRASDGPSDLVRHLLQSGKLEACLARHYFRFTFARYEDPARDGCALERLRARLVETGHIRDMLEEVALLPELQQRRFEP